MKSISVIFKEKLQLKMQRKYWLQIKKWVWLQFQKWLPLIQTFIALTTHSRPGKIVRPMPLGQNLCTPGFLCEHFLPRKKEKKKQIFSRIGKRMKKFQWILNTNAYLWYLYNAYTSCIIPSTFLRPVNDKNTQS